MPLVELTKHGGVALLTLNNPPANAYSHAMHRELDAAYERTHLPERPDYEAANRFLLKARRSAVQLAEA